MCWQSRILNLHNILDTAVKNRRVLTDDASDREAPSPLQTKGTANALQSGRMDGLPLLQHRPDATAQHHPSIAKSRLPTSK